MYRCLLVDNDQTLMDFHRAEQCALRKTLMAWGYENPEEAAQIYTRVNNMHWKKLEKGKTTLQALRINRFRDFLKETARNPSQAETLVENYELSLSRQRDLMPGAEAFLKKISSCIPVALLTNGIGRIQRGRLRGNPIAPYLSAVIISEEVGLAKPDPAIARLAMQALECNDPRQAVLLGDSLSADIACARAAGIDSVWLAPAGKNSDEPTYVAHTLEEAAKFILNGCLPPIDAES